MLKCKKQKESLKIKKKEEQEKAKKEYLEKFEDQMTKDIDKLHQAKVEEASTLMLIRYDFDHEEALRHDDEADILLEFLIHEHNQTKIAKLPLELVGATEEYAEILHKGALLYEEIIETAREKYGKK